MLKHTHKYIYKYKLFYRNPVFACFVENNSRELANKGVVLDIQCVYMVAIKHKESMQNACACLQM